MPQIKRLRTDNDYIQAGLEPPVHLPHFGSDRIEPDVHLHKWEVRGGFLHCAQGQHGHGIPYDHLHKRFVGTSAEGAPLFKDIVLSKKVPYTETNVTTDVSNVV